MKKKNRIKFSILLCLNLITVFLLVFTFLPVHPAETGTVLPTLSKMGSRGTEVKAIQEKLKERGLYKGSVDGIFGSQTQTAVKRFQKQQAP